MPCRPPETTIWQRSRNSSSAPTRTRPAAAAVAPVAVTLAGPRDGVYHLPRLPYRIAVVAR
jgi:hypothetical protein